MMKRVWSTCASAEETDREAQALTAIVFLAPPEIYCAALGPVSLSHTEPHHPNIQSQKLII